MKSDREPLTQRPHDERGEIAAGQAPNRRDVLLATTALAASAFVSGGPIEAAAAGQPVAASGKPPNIIYFLVDNLGYGELGCYGGGILRGADTRRIDAFAGQGTKLLNFAPEAQPRRRDLP